MSEGNTPVIAGDSKTDGEQAESAAMMGIPVSVQVVLGKTKMPVSKLIGLGRGAVIEIDRKAGESVDVTVTGRVMERGEIVIVADQRNGVNITEIVRNGR